MAGRTTWSAVKRLKGVCPDATGACALLRQFTVSILQPFPTRCNDRKFLFSLVGVFLKAMVA